MLKLILVGVALSLMYAVEVGKVYGEDFGGMMPEELRDLLNGKIAPSPTFNRELNEHERLTLNLIQRAHDQLTFLSLSEKKLAITVLLNYIDQSRKINPMIDPKKVFEDALDARIFPSSRLGDQLKG
jgi:hypothetical protein